MQCQIKQTKTLEINIDNLVFGGPFRRPGPLWLMSDPVYVNLARRKRLRQKRLKKGTIYQSPSRMLFNQIFIETIIKRNNL